MKDLKVSIRSDLVREQGRVRYRMFHRGGREHYNVRVWVEGPQAELAKINKVEYELHLSFRNRHRVRDDASEKFALELWTWGMFDIEVTFHLKSGCTESTHFYLRYSLPTDSEENYIQVK